MPLGLILGLGRAMRRKRTSSLDILSSKRGPRDYYKGKNCKSTGFHTRKGGYVVVNEKLPNYVVPAFTDFKLKPYVSQCPREFKTADWRFYQICLKMCLWCESHLSSNGKKTPLNLPSALNYGQSLLSLRIFLFPFIPKYTQPVVWKHCINSC